MTEHATTTATEPGRLHRFLNDTPPSKLLIWCFVAISLAAICGVARVSLQTGMSWSDSQQFYEGASDSISFATSVDYENDRSGLVRLKGVLAFVLGVGAFICGAIAALLPMWTVGRLISDAIREGHTHE
jgi:hypothetical protein